MGQQGRKGQRGCERGGRLQEAGVESLGTMTHPCPPPTPPSPARAGGIRPFGEAWGLHPHCCRHESPPRPRCSSLAQP